jgi:homocysteine S-methyltransferase
MASAHPFLTALHERVVLADGAMGTSLYDHGIYINRCYDAISLENPSLIQQIHQSFLAVGCEVLETNTFGANRLRLKAHGLDDKVNEVNQAAVRCAQEAIKRASEHKPLKAWVAGSMGPLGQNSEPLGPLKSAYVSALYEEQATALESAGVDLFILETFTHLDQLEQAIDGVRRVSSKPLVALMTVNEHGESLVGEDSETMITRLNTMRADVLGVNCSYGPSIVLETLDVFRTRTQKPLAAFPNAGLPKQVGGRFIYVSSPEYFGSYAKKFVSLGVSFLGGCCGTTPPHMSRARDAIASAGKSGRVSMTVSELKPSDDTTAAVPLAERSRLAKKLASGSFAISVEIDPPKGTQTAKVMEAARLCHEAGIDCINIADGPRASARMNPSSMAVLMEREIGIETIIHYCCRDRNILGMQSDLLGAHALGLRNILLITGDPLKLGDYPEASGVFEIDSIGLTKMVKRLNHGRDLGSNPLGSPTSFLQGVGCNPGSLNFENEMRRLREKIEAGAEFVMTQPVYDAQTFERFLHTYTSIPKHPPLMIGICPLISLRNAEFLHHEVPGMQIPDEIMKRMAKPTTAEGQRAEGIAIAREALEMFRKDVQGTYIMPPFNRADIALAVVQDFIEKPKENYAS